MLMLVLCWLLGRVPSCTSSQMRPKRAPCAARISSRLVINLCISCKTWHKRQLGTHDLALLVLVQVILDIF